MAIETTKQIDCGLHAIIGGQTIPFQNVADKFEALAEAWNNEHPGSSIIQYDSFSLHQIIGMGAAAIPLLLERLEDGEGHWVYALTCIAGEQAHSDTMNGDAEQIIQAWLDWGRRRGGSHGRLTA
jgi:hypothetical protein